MKLHLKGKGLPTKQIASPRIFFCYLYEVPWANYRDLREHCRNVDNNSRFITSAWKLHYGYFLNTMQQRSWLTMFLQLKSKIYEPEKKTTVL